MKTRLFLLFTVLALSVNQVQAGGCRPATLDITVSTDADVQVDGVTVGADGAPVRHVCTDLAPGELRFTEVRATWMVNGHETSQTQRVSLSGGDHKSVLFNRPS